ncbi:hypothetical protein PanWU01x14_234120 [Parasponia andersonii]|uniref:Transmembrane protein n=1 Tax=Parasponia andersonii TaxID=3476 RepID=A0A2P5BJB3_PARAD|nr:hypothetical protein PanWU01x14_234120 [Parasponia andersonii]
MELERWYEHYLFTITITAAIFTITIAATLVTIAIAVALFTIAIVVTEVVLEVEPSASEPEAEAVAEVDAEKLVRVVLGNIDTIDAKELDKRCQNGQAKLERTNRPGRPIKNFNSRAQPNP